VSAALSGEGEWRRWCGWSAAATFEGEFSGVTNSYAGKGVGPVSVVRTHVVASKDVRDEKARTKRRLDGCAAHGTRIVAR